MSDATRGTEGELPVRPGQDAPVFTAPRRTKGPGKGPMLGVFVALAIAGASAVAWHQFGGVNVPSVPEGALPNAAADSVQALVDAEAEESQPETPPPPLPVRLAFTVEPAAATVTVDDSLTASQLPAGNTIWPSWAGSGKARAGMSWVAGSAVPE